MKFLGQRGLIAALTALVMLVLGAVLGMPGHFPTIEGVEYSPEHWFNLIGGAILPLGLILANFKALSDALSARVNNPQDPFNAANLLDLLKSKEFWVYAVSAGVGIAQIFGLKVMPEEQQIVLSNALLGIATTLLGSWADRPSGMRTVTLTPIRPNTDGDN